MVLEKNCPQGKSILSAQSIFVRFTFVMLQKIVNENCLELFLPLLLKNNGDEKGVACGTFIPLE